MISLMFDIAKARQAMVDSQLHTAGVVDPRILSAFASIPRDAFVPANLKSMAYCDEDISLGKGRFLAAPMLQAKLLQAAQPKAHEIVLDVGCALGYSSAILSSLVSTVVALESDKGMAEQVDRLCESVGACNVVGVQGALNQGYPKYGPYDLIIVNGACAEIPQLLVDQLSPEGRLLLVFKPASSRIGVAQIVRKQSGVGKSGFSSYTLFDAAAPYLKGFEPQADFVFT